MYLRAEARVYVCVHICILSILQRKKYRVKIIVIDHPFLSVPSNPFLSLSGFTTIVAAVNDPGDSAPPVCWRSTLGLSHRDLREGPRSEGAVSAERKGQCTRHRNPKGQKNHRPPTSVVEPPRFVFH